MNLRDDQSRLTWNDVLGRSFSLGVHLRTSSTAKLSEGGLLRYGLASSTLVNSDATACQRPFRFTKRSVHR